MTLCSNLIQRETLLQLIQYNKTARQKPHHSWRCICYYQTLTCLISMKVGCSDLTFTGKN